MARPTTTPGGSAGRAVGLVGLCLVGAGLLGYGFFAVVARSTSVGDYKNFGAFWSLVLVVGFGVFLPIEQELARVLHGPAVDHRSAMRAAFGTASGLALAEIVVLLALSPLLVDVFDGRVAYLICLGALSLAVPAQFVVRGMLIGTNRLRPYGLILILEAASRVAFAGVLAALVVTDSAGYAWTVVAAIAVAHLPLLPGLMRSTSAHPGEPVRVRSFAAAVTPLLAGSLAAQLLLNGIPVLVAAVATAGEQNVAGQFQAVFLLARVPLFVAVPLQTTILPALTRLLNSGRPHLAFRVITWFAAGLISAATLGAVVAYAAGPWLVELVFGSQYRMSGFDVAAMVVGVVVYLGLIILTQALVASTMHAKVALSWLFGLVVAAAVFAAVPDLTLRAELAFLLGSAVGATVGMAQLVVRHRQREERVPQSG